MNILEQPVDPSRFVMILDQTACKRPGLEKHRFNQQVYRSKTVEGLLNQLYVEHGIQSPKRLTETNTIFVDSASDPEGRQAVGFLNRRWSEDCSHPGPKWWEENWITFREELTFPLKTLKQHLQRAHEHQTTTD